MKSRRTIVLALALCMAAVTTVATATIVPAVETGTVLAAAPAIPGQSEARVETPTQEPQACLVKDDPTLSIVQAAEQVSADARKGGCGPHIQSCPASQAGQPCDPNNLNVLCSLQRNGAYCCLAYAP